MIKGSYSKKHDDTENPFDHGNCFLNFCCTLCAPLPPSAIDRRGYATQQQISEYEAAQARAARYTGASKYGGSNQPAGVKPYPVMDMESYDTSHAKYPRQQTAPDGTVYSSSKPSTANNGNLVVCDVKEPSVVISTQASGGETGEGKRRNVVEFHQSQRYSIPAGDGKDVGDAPTHTANFTQGDIGSDDPGSASIYSTDSSALLLDKQSSRNGLGQLVALKSEKTSKRAKVSAV